MKSSWARPVGISTEIGWKNRVSHARTCYSKRLVETISEKPEYKVEKKIHRLGERDEAMKWVNGFSVSIRFNSHSIFFLPPQSYPESFLDENKSGQEKESGHWKRGFYQGIKKWKHTWTVLRVLGHLHTQCISPALPTATSKMLRNTFIVLNREYNQAHLHPPLPFSLWWMQHRNITLLRPSRVTWFRGLTNPPPTISNCIHPSVVKTLMGQWGALVVSAGSNIEIRYLTAIQVNYLILEVSNIVS